MDLAKLKLRMQTHQSPPRLQGASSQIETHSHLMNFSLFYTRVNPGDFGVLTSPDKLALPINIIGLFRFFLLHKCSSTLIFPNQFSRRLPAPKLSLGKRGSLGIFSPQSCGGEDPLEIKVDWRLFVGHSEVWVPLKCMARHWNAASEDCRISPCHVSLFVLCRDNLYGNVKGAEKWFIWH